MSIRIKVSRVVVLTFFVLFTALFFGVRAVVLSNFEQLETETTARNVQRIQAVLQDTFTAMTGTVLDWANWDDTRAFVQGEYPQFVDANLNVDALTNLNLNMMLFYNTAGELVYASTAETNVIPESFSRLMTPDSPLLNHAELDHQIVGFVRIPETLMIVASAPILSSNFEGPAAGSVVLVRFLDDPQIATLAEALQFELTILPPDDAALPADITAALTSDTTVTTRIVDESIIQGYGLLIDIFGVPTGVVQINVNRAIYARGQDTVELLALILLTAGLVIPVLTTLVLESVVLRRITRLSGEVNVIQSSTDANQRVTVVADDEVSTLGSSINAMLDRLAENRARLARQNAELEAAYREIETSNRLKSEFLSTMSHELRTPLNAVIGYSGLLLEGIGGDIDDEARLMISRIEDSSHRLLRLINDVLDLSKIEAGRLVLVENRFAVRELLNTLGEQTRVLVKPGVRFAILIAPDVPAEMYGDKDRIAQIVVNLLSNAFKFTAAGQVTLDTRYEQRTLMVEVRDTGIGIPPHALQFIFDEFRQVDGSAARVYEGTGLGLSIVKKLTEAMGGQVQVSSKLGVGTTFTVVLPLPPVIDPAVHQVLPSPSTA